MTQPFPTDKGSTPSVTELVAETFVIDVARHEFTLLHDEGSYRHLRMATPASGLHFYEVVTSPGTLVVVGDMGAYVFRSLHGDLFDHFRDQPVDPAAAADLVRAPEELMEFSPETFEESARAAGQRWLGAHPGADRDAFFRKLEAEVLMPSFDARSASSAAYAFTFGDRVVFPHPDQLRSSRYRYQFVWVLHAIRHAIEAYDARPGGLSPVGLPTDTPDSYSQIDPNREDR